MSILGIGGKGGACPHCATWCPQERERREASTVAFFKPCVRAAAAAASGSASSGDGEEAAAAAVRAKDSQRGELRANADLVAVALFLWINQTPLRRPPPEVPCSLLRFLLLRCRVCPAPYLLLASYMVDHANLAAVGPP